MSREYQLTDDQPDIKGMFWAPGRKTKRVAGILQLKAGQTPILETAEFTRNGVERKFPSRKKAPTGTNVVDDWFAPGQRVIHGHDDHGRSLTLIDCHSGGSHSTLALIGHSYSCQAALFGAALVADKLQFDGVRLRFDHQDEWLDRYAFGRHSEIRDDTDSTKRVTKIVIPRSEQASVPLNLDGYAKSEFFLGWSMSPGTEEFHLKSRSFLDLTFKKPRSWKDVLWEIHYWRWFFSLATRTTVDVAHASLHCDEIRVPIGSEPMEDLEVWLPRSHSKSVDHPKRHKIQFHFTFEDVESCFADVIKKWQAIRKPWSAVLHRFFAIAGRRKVLINEEFLFLAQSVESLHRARTGKAGDVSMAHAAKEAYLQSPPALQCLLGKRGTFVNQVHKSRNYWTHYGTPGPGDDPNILDGDDLIELNEKLRWIVEAAILTEIGVPTRCVERVWSPQWKLHLVRYQ